MYQQSPNGIHNSGSTNISTRDAPLLGASDIVNQIISGVEQHKTSAAHEFLFQESTFQEIPNINHAQNYIKNARLHKLYYDSTHSHKNIQSQCKHPATDIQQPEDQNLERTGK